MKLPGDPKWSLGSCVKVLRNRSYEVEVAGCCYHRNRHQLRTTAESPSLQPLEENLLHDDNSAKSPSANQESSSDISDYNQSANDTPQPLIEPWQSTRVRKLPIWHKDFDMN